MSRHFLVYFAHMKNALILLTITLFALSLKAQDLSILDNIYAKGTTIASVEARINKVLQRKDNTIVQNGDFFYVSPDKVTALFDDGNYMIINGNRMSIDIGVFHGRYKLNRNKTMRSISRIFLYGIQGRCKDFLEESGYTMETIQKDGLQIIQFTTKKKHFLGLGYRVVIFKYDLNELLLRELVLIDYNDFIDTFTISEPKHNVKINEEKFAQ